MRKLATLLLSIFVLAVPAFADSPKDDDAQPAAAAKEKPAAKAAKTDAAAQPTAAAKSGEKTDAALAAEIEELRQAIQAQQEQLQILKEELTKRDKQIDEAREAAASANARATEASAKATETVNSTAEVKATTDSLNSTVSSLKTSTGVLTATAGNVGPNAGVAGNANANGNTTNGGSANGNGQEENPVALRYKGITLTPGGFVAAETVSRTKATGATINTPFNGIPYPGADLAHVSENSFTARQSRLSLLAEGTVGAAKLTGYYEADWLGTGVTYNDRQRNS
jgi:hypothetical protein